MNKGSGRPIKQRLMALGLAVLLAVTCFHTDAVTNYLGNLLGTDETQSLTVHARRMYDATTIYDAGVMQLSAHDATGSGVNPWRVVSLESAIPTDTYTLKDTIGANAWDELQCYADALGTDIDEPGHYVTDYGAPQASDLDPTGSMEYCYIAQGTCTPVSGDDYDVTWTVYMWPKGQGYSQDNPTYTSQDDVKAQWDLVVADVTRDNNMIVSGTFDPSKATKYEDTVSRFGSDFGRARPRWESGNYHYTDWYGTATGEDADLDPSAVIDYAAGRLLNGHNIMWQSTDGSTYYPWLSIMLHDTAVTDDDYTNSGDPNDNAGELNNDHYIAYTWPHTGVDGIKAITSQQVPDSDPDRAVNVISGGIYPDAMGESGVMNTADTTAAGDKAAGYFQVPLSKSNGYSTTSVFPSWKEYSSTHNKYVALPDFLYEAFLHPVYMNYRANAATMNKIATRTEVTSGSMQLLRYWNGKGSGIPAPYKPKGNKVAGYRQYGLWEGGWNGTAQQFSRIMSLRNLEYALGKDASHPGTSAPDDAANAYRRLTLRNTSDPTSGVEYVNVMPIYDVTFEYQRAYGSVKGRFNTKDIAIIGTNAYDPVTSDTTEDPTRPGYFKRYSQEGYSGGGNSVTVRDHVHVNNVANGVQYCLVSYLYAIDGNAHQGLNGKPYVAAAKTMFTGGTNPTAHIVTEPLTFDPTDVIGKTLVVWDYIVFPKNADAWDAIDVDHLFDDSTGAVGTAVLASASAVHTKDSDVDQQIVFLKHKPVGARITKTLAVDATSTDDAPNGTGTHIGIVSSASKIRDTIWYEGAQPGEQYTVRGTLYAVLVNDDGSLGSAQEIPNSSVQETFNADPSGSGRYVRSSLFNVADAASYAKDNKIVVVYEELFAKDEVTGKTPTGVDDVVWAHPGTYDEIRDGETTKKRWRFDQSTAGTTDQMVCYPAIKTEVDYRNIDPVENIDITDSIVLTGLVSDCSYQLTGKLIDLKDNKPVVSKGANVEKTTPVFTGAEYQAAAEDSPLKKMKFEGVDLSAYGDHNLIIHQFLSAVDDRGNMVPVAQATNNKDVYETVKVSQPVLVTSLGETGTGQGIMPPSEHTKLTDMHRYSGLQAGADYKAVVSLVDEDGNEIKDIHGNVVSKAVTFTATASTMPDMNIDLPEFNSKPYENKSVVAYSYLYRVIDGVDRLVLSDSNLEELLAAGSEVVSFPGDTAMKTVAHVASSRATHSPATDSLNLVDDVRLMGLEIGKTYKLETRLFDKTAGDFIESVSETTEVAVDKMVMNVSIPFTINAASLTGHYLVVYQTLWNGDTEVLKHEDPDDVAQTIIIDVPTMTTEATSDVTKSHEVPCAPSTKITDKVEYTGLVTGKSYTLVTTVVDKVTGNIAKGIPETKTTFTPNASKGNTSVSITADTLALAGKTLVVTEKLLLGGTEEVGKHEDLEDEKQTLVVEQPTFSTVATYAETKSHEIPCLPMTTISDKISYEKLQPGVNYTITTTFYDKATKNVVRIDGYALDPVSTTFTPTEASGEVVIDAEIDTTELAGRTLVLFETFSVNNIKVGGHEDINDAQQTVTIRKPKISTSAKGDETGDHTLPFSTKATLVDKVTFENLEPGYEYTLRLALYDRDTKKPLEKTVTNNNNNSSNNNSNNNNNNNTKKESITASSTFEVEGKSGDESVSVTFDATPFVGKKIVAYEELSIGGVVVATHKDINDDEQTVEVVRPGLSTEALDTYNGTHTISEPVQNELLAQATTSSTGKSGTTGVSGTSGASGSTGSSQSASITDKVYYSGLQKGETYTLTTTLVDKATGEAITANGSKVSNASASTSGSSSSGSSSSGGLNTSFTATGWSGSVNIPIPVDISALAGKTIVVYEELSSGKNVGSKHHDINDLAQTVYIGAIATELAGPMTQDPKNVGVSSKLQLVDTVAFFGLEPGQTYTIIGKIMNYDAVTGQVGGSSNLGTTGTTSQAPVGSTTTGGSKSKAPMVLNTSYDTKTEEEITLGSDDTTVKETDKSATDTKSTTGVKSTTDTKDTTNSSTTKPATTSDGKNSVIGIAGGNNGTKSSTTKKETTSSTEPTTTPAKSGTSEGTAPENSGATAGTATTQPAQPVYGSNMAKEVGSFAFTFKATQSSGLLAVPFVVDTRNLQQHKLVAYETIYKGTKPILAHTDINDPNQTVTVGTSSGSSWKTGVESYADLFIWIALGLIAVATAIVGVMAYRKRRSIR